jgi:hypothetical protein
LSGYPYSDIIRGRFSVFFSGGDVAEDINCHLRDSPACIPGNRVPGADTLLRGIKEPATEMRPLNREAERITNSTSIME